MGSSFYMEIIKQKLHWYCKLSKSSTFQEDWICRVVHTVYMVLVSIRGLWQYRLHCSHDIPCHACMAPWAMTCSRLLHLQDINYRLVTSCYVVPELDFNANCFSFHFLAMHDLWWILDSAIVFAMCIASIVHKAWVHREAFEERMLQVKIYIHALYNYS